MTAADAFELTAPERLALRRLASGAPGVYPLPRERVRAFTGERMDVCAFVGVAPRGPCREPLVDHTAAHADGWRMCDPARPRRRTVPVAVESFDAYSRLFGGAEGPFAGPGLLPYAVAAFFEQGGRRAWIARIVHDYDGPDDLAGRASGLLPGVAGAVRLHARDEGVWGDRLRARLSWRARRVEAAGAGLLELRIGRREPLCAGALLRLRLADDSRVLRWVIGVRDRPDPASPTTLRVATLDAAPGADVVEAEVVEAALRVEDGAGGEETFSGLGLHVDHPRWLADVLCRDSRLLWPDWSWAGGRVTPLDAALLTMEPPAKQFTGGADRFADIVHDDMFDAAWVSPADSHADGARPAGVPSLALIPDLTQIVVPDLYQPRPAPVVEDIRERTLAGAEFADCFDARIGAQAEVEAELPGLQLDPRLPADLQKIIGLQQTLVAFAEATAEHIVLLDVPPGLRPHQVLAWRGAFDSAWAAAYHPWTRAAPAGDRRSGLVDVPPSATAAGMIADREVRFGVPVGPANDIARQAVVLDQTLPPAEHDLLHVRGINVFLLERDGVRLTAARTLSLDPAWRQLSVRRLMLMLRRALRRQMEWAVFEPNNAALRRDLQRTLGDFLRGLYRSGALRGDTEDAAFFVRCDDVLNPPARIDAGQLVVEVGVAPAEPLEFIVLRFTRRDDGLLLAEG